MMTRKRFAAIVVSMFLFAWFTSVSAKSGSQYHLVKTIHLPGNGHWDLLTADSNSRKLYVTHDTVVHVIDMDTDRLIGNVTGDIGHTHGVALAPAVNRGYVTSSLHSTIASFALDTRKIIGQIPSWKGPDAIAFDPKTNRIFAFNEDVENITVVNPKSNKVIGSIPLTSGPEAGVADGKGTLFLNLVDRNQVAVIDTSKLTITKQFSTLPGTKPTGLAVDPIHHLLFVGCRNRKMVVLNATTGAHVADFPIGNRVDTTLFDPASRLIFNSNGDGTLTILHEDSPNQFSGLRTIKTQFGAKTMAIDLKTGNLYLATAQFEPGFRPAPGRRPKVVPGTFVLLKFAP